MANDGLDRNPTQIDISLKKLLNLEFTSTNRKDFQELGANTIDINSTEVFTDTVSSNPATAVAAGIAKQYDKFTLTADPIVNTAYYVMSGSGFVPGTDTYDVTKKQRNFLSPKYGSGYKVELIDGGDNSILQSEIDWHFDYKTGIVVFEDPTQLTDDGFAAPFKISVYQYVGKTLDTSLSEVGGTSGIFLQTGSYYNTTNNVGITGSFEVGGAGVNVDFTGAANGVSGSFSGSFNGSHTGTGNFTTLGATTATLGTVTATGLTVNGNLVVDGTTTTINTTNLEVEDQFIFLNNSGSEAGGRDGGIVVERTTNDQGTALFWDNSDEAWAIDVAGVGKAATSADPNVYVVGVGVGSLPSSPTLGNTDNSEKSRKGQMWVDDSADIWIYS